LKTDAIENRRELTNIIRKIEESDMQVQPYLFFEGRTEEALNFYKNKLGAEVTMLMRFNEAPQPPKDGQLPPGMEDKVMHASFRLGDTTLMASDGPTGGQQRFQNFALSISARNEAEAEKMFDGLADGGKVKQPLTKTFFSPRFGMVDDRFGVSWMVIVQ
jgi:PhnB protein